MENSTVPAVLPEISGDAGDATPGEMATEEQEEEEMGIAEVALDKEAERSWNEEEEKEEEVGVAENAGEKKFKGSWKEKEEEEEEEVGVAENAGEKNIKDPWKEEEEEEVGVAEGTGEKDVEEKVPPMAPTVAAPDELEEEMGEDVVDVDDKVEAGEAETGQAGLAGEEEARLGKGAATPSSTTTRQTDKEDWRIRKSNCKIAGIY